MMRNFLIMKFIKIWKLHTNNKYWLKTKNLPNSLQDSWWWKTESFPHLKAVNGVWKCSGMEFFRSKKHKKVFSLFCGRERKRMEIIFRKEIISHAPYGCERGKMLRNFLLFFEWFVVCTQQCARKRAIVLVINNQIHHKTLRV